MKEPELTPRDFFDGGRVFAQLTRLIAQPRVLRALTGDGGGQIVVVAARGSIAATRDRRRVRPPDTIAT
jgi:hypothetical protein